MLQSESYSIWTYQKGPHQYKEINPLAHHLPGCGISFKKTANKEIFGKVCKTDLFKLVYL